MATGQQQQTTIFSGAEAQRFAALVAGLDIGNPNNAEAMTKGSALRRMLIEKKIRLVDAFELTEIRQALDAQMQPVRQPAPDVMAMQREIADLRRKLAVTVPKVRKLAEELAAERKGWSDFLLIFFGVVGAVDLVFAVLLVLKQCWWGSAVAGTGALGSAVFLLKRDVIETNFMDVLETVKEKAVLCYAWSSHIFFGLGVLTYVAWCIVAGELVGPKTYIGFLYHCCQWKVIHG